MMEFGSIPVSLCPRSDAVFRNKPDAQPTSKIVKDFFGLQREISFKMISKFFFLTTSRKDIISLSFLPELKM
jgi:hypothetical protein